MGIEIQRYRLFYYSISNTRMKQLFFRLILMIKRNIYVKLLGNFLSEKHALSKQTYELLEKRHKPLFSPRDHLINNKELVFLNYSKPLSSSIDWHPSEMETGTRLWLLNLHYMEFLEALNNDMFYTIVLDWINKNKPYRAGYWLDDWNSYALSIRVVVWMVV